MIKEIPESMKSIWIWVGLIVVACQGNCFAADVQFDPLILVPRNYLSNAPEKALTSQSVQPDKSPRRYSKSETMIAAEIQPLPNQANQAALALQRLGFRVLHIGQTISVQAPRSLWESTFNVSFEQQKKPIMPEIGQTGEMAYLRADTENLRLPEQLQNVVAEVMFVEPPQLF